MNFQLLGCLDDCQWAQMPLWAGGCRFDDPAAASGGGGVRDAGAGAGADVTASEDSYSMLGSESFAGRSSPPWALATVATGGVTTDGSDDGDWFDVDSCGVGLYGDDDDKTIASAGGGSGRKDNGNGNGIGDYGDDGELGGMYDESDFDGFDEDDDDGFEL